MAIFRYKAINADGKPTDGEIEAADAQAAVAQLRASGHLPISAEPKADHLHLSAILRPMHRRQGRVRSADLSALTGELATLLLAGIPLDASLRILERHAPEGSRIKAVLKRIHGDVQAGKTLSAALALHDDIFDPLYISLVRAGEASGSLSLVMSRLARHLEQVDLFRSTVLSALTYPAILVCVAIVSLVVLLAFVIPRFIPLFEDSGGTLPLLTEIVFGVSGSLQQGWWALLALVGGTKIFIDRWLAVPANGIRFDQWLLRAPIAGKMVVVVETARFARTLETLLRNGLPLLTALKFVRDVQRNRIFARAVDNAIESVRAGGRLAAALKREAVLPDLAVEFVMIGEESGQLEDMLLRAAEAFEARAQQTMKRVLTLLEPTLILGLGAVIAIVIVSILMAMLGLNELVV